MNKNLCWICNKSEAVSFGYCSECLKETRQAIRPWLCKIVEERINENQH